MTRSTKSLRTLAALLLFTASGIASTPPPEIPLWPNGAPGSEGKPTKEDVTTSASGEMRVAGIHNPSITPYLPTKETATGLGILVIPGGGHRLLAITHEGYNVAEWFQAHGIAAFVLKHRLAREPNSTYRIDVESLADTKRAMRLIRSRAKEWNVDPARLGAIGFSAGGELVWLAASRGDAGDPAAADSIERQSSRPDFQALIYPGRSGDIQPATGAPPAFLAAAYDDRQDISEGLAEVYLRFKRVDVPAELHIYGTGGHGFGVRASNKRPVGQWIVRFEEWLRESGFFRQPSQSTR
jgi:endo-1,4-beta-xylanase